MFRFVSVIVFVALITCLGLLKWLGEVEVFNGVLIFSTILTVSYILFALIHGNLVMKDELYLRGVLKTWDYIEVSDAEIVGNLVEGSDTEEYRVSIVWPAGNFSEMIMKADRLEKGKSFLLSFDDNNVALLVNTHTEKEFLFVKAVRTFDKSIFF